MAMTKKRWSDLSPTARRMIVCGAAFDGTLRIAALVDLKRRPAAQVRGSKKAWAAALTLVNSAGVLPLAYFLRGRSGGRGDRGGRGGCCGGRGRCCGRGS